ncbi:alpha-mannosidase [Deinococcus yavapaiensis]|uniref:Alpha-mannosidase n=1 Tax=Deinococcus yavapaiensis KR-236 TaxID=694435 RepID=A0A318S8Z4_9DEIO|nr:alpha-mannosidase [Deinococcus yavapaiensis]PYE54605.1 alpha-mannosidase [Deinococcus yavapaiensis KR-236]
MIDFRSKTLTVHLVGHAHIDPVWLWNWREGHETVKATFRSALDRLRENPDMVFVHSSAAQYAWMEAHPKLLAEVKDAVQRGQWEPVGGWWVEPDVNLPHGEALARQALIGQRTLERLVGKRARVGFLPDSFGHPSTLPQFLVESGLNAFVFMRPNANEIDLPSNLFVWEGADGSRILSARVECYNSSPLWIESSLKRNLDWRPQELDVWLGLFGVGNHGGGPTKRAIRNLRDLNASPEWPDLKMNSLSGFFDVVREESRPVYQGSLQHHARGCYAAVSEIKALNRRAEYALIRAEKLAVLASSYGYPYPKDELTRAWKRLLFNQFHDILAGSSIESAYDDARHEIGEALGVASRVTFAAMQAVADRVDTRLNGRDADEPIRSVRWDGPTWVTDYGDGVPVLIFNASDRPRSEIVDVELNDWHTPRARLTDESGRDVLAQVSHPESASGGRPRFVFRAEVPAFGYRLYRVTDEDAGEVEHPGLLRVSPTGLENDFWSLRFDADTGALTSLRDNTRGLELLAGGAQVVAVKDETDTWGHGMRSLRHLLGAFANAKLEVVESGPVRATLRVTTTFRNSTAALEFSLSRGSKDIGLDLELDWRERHACAQFVLPTALADVRATFSVPYGSEERPADGEEEPTSTWTDVSGLTRDGRGVRHAAGLSLVSDSKTSASVLGGELRLTLSRSPVYAHHDPATLDPALKYRYVDQGRQVARLAMRPHEGDWRAARVPEFAENFGQPLTFVREYVHDGDLPQRASQLQLSGLESASVSAMKRSEDGDDVVVRLVEWAGASTLGTMRFGPSSHDIALRPFEILTLRLSGGEATRVNFLEEPHDRIPS